MTFAGRSAEFSTIPGAENGHEPPPALEVLLSRVSALPSQLQHPPTAAELEQILDAATRAADHGWLRPWRFLLVSGPARRHLGNLLHGAYQRQRPGLDPKTLERVRRYPQRIPLMIGIVAVTADCQIPAQEQILSAGAAAQNMLNAAHALDLGAMWISPMIGSDAEARAALRLGASDNLIGWLCVGSLKSALRAKKRPAGIRFAQLWLEQGVTAPYAGADPAAELKAAE